MLFSAFIQYTLPLMRFVFLRPAICLELLSDPSLAIIIFIPTIMVNAAHRWNDKSFFRHPCFWLIVTPNSPFGICTL